MKLPLLMSAALAAGIAHGAITVTHPPTGTWQAPGWTPNESGTEFFSNKSVDNPPGKTGCNVGYWLASNSWNTLASNCNNESFNPGDSGPGTLAFLSGPTANTPTGFSFKNTSGKQEVQYLNLRLEVSGRNAQGAPTDNIFGYTLNGVDTDLFGQGINPTNAGNVQLILNDGDTLSFYIRPAGSATVKYRSETSYDPTNGRSGRFALFSEVPTNPVSLNTPLSKYWIAVEDSPSGNAIEGLGDYNDFLVSIAVPEPGFYLTLSGGMLAMLGAAYRRRKQQNNEAAE